MEAAAECPRRKQKLLLYHAIIILGLTSGLKSAKNCTLSTPTVTLTILGPQIVNQPLQLYCEVITERDISNADIVWRRNNTAVNITCIIALATSGGLYRSYYTITQLNTSDDGIMYECGLVVHATSSVIAGTGTVHLNVTTLVPVVSILPEKQVEVREGEHVELACFATGLGANSFIYQWFLNNQPVAGQDASTLAIIDISENNTGDYKCFVRNYHGIGQSEATTLVLDRYCNPVTVDYGEFNITWNETQSGDTVISPCTGNGLNGTVRRRCIIDDEWEEFFDCFNIGIGRLLNQVTNLVNDHEVNEVQIIAVTNDVTYSLVNLTAPTQEPIFTQDINLAIEVVSTLINVTETVIANLTTNDTFFENCATVIDNLLSDINRDSWEQLERTSPSTSQALLSSAEQVTKLLSETLTNDTTEVIKTRPNIVIKAEQVSNNSVHEGYVFPDEDDSLTAYTGGNAQLLIPSELLQNITTGSNSNELTIAITVISNNSSLRLSSSNSDKRTLITQSPASPIFSLQVNPPPILSASAENSIMMVFDVDPIAVGLSMQRGVQDEQGFTVDDVHVSCNFYDYTLVTNNNLNQIGGWSTDGLTVGSTNPAKTSVTCLTTHLTSFAVLVSIQDERQPSSAKALSLISKIGCCISLACLCVSIILLSYTLYKAKDDNKNILFVHLNLCIALALGLAVFVAGIENATSNEIGCKLTAVLLQYLFTSAFCWMLCEGVILYMKLVTVFSNKLNKQRFFIILGWGPAIPIVAISAGVAHKYYGTSYYCWIKSDDGAIAAFIAPIATIILINTIFLGITLKVLWKHKTTKQQTASNQSTVKSLLKAVMILSPLLGVTWIIGIFSVNNATQVFAWIFAVLNSLQGVFILILNVIRNKQVAKEMKECYNNIRKNITRLFSVCSSSGTSTSSKAKTIASQLQINPSELNENIYENVASGAPTLKTPINDTLK